jgi:hypothetical protein
MNIIEVYRRYRMKLVARVWKMGKKYIIGVPNHQDELKQLRGKTLILSVEITGEPEKIIE